MINYSLSFKIKDKQKDRPEKNPLIDVKDRERNSVRKEKSRNLIQCQIPVEAY